MRDRIIAAALASAALSFAPALLAAERPQAGSQASDPVVAQPGPQNFGTTDVHVAVVPAQAFMPENSATTFQNANGVLSETSATGDWWAGVHLPSGARVEAVEIEACDTDAAGAIAFGLARFIGPVASFANVTPVTSTGATPGCDYFGATVTTPFTMDNFNHNLKIFVNFGATSTTNRLSAVRVYYHLQVSPAPAVATFPNDVPTTHPIFRFVEALAAAGITGGCGPNSFCPDAPLTRGQMAVFLSTALGLHFAP
jgi:S-layer family protein